MPLSALFAYRQFIVWKAMQYPGEPKPRKVPISFVTGAECDAHDAANWTDYHTAMAMVPLVGATGVGFVLTPGDPIACIDLDHCLVNGQYTDFAIYVMSVFPNAATELSYSGDGLHLWMHCDPTQLPHNHRTRSKDVSGLEVYTSNRFIALGHQVFHGDAGTDYTESLVQLLNHYLPGTTTEATEWTDTPDPGWHGPEDDDVLIGKMFAARQSAASVFGGKASFADLWNGNADALAATYPSETGDDFDHSSADAALMSHLAFWTGKNCARMDALFRRSALMREKYETRPDYQHHTITRACGWTTAVYSDTPQQQIGTTRPQFPQRCLEVGGLIGDVCQWIDGTAPKPQPILTLAAVITSLGALFGGRYAIEPLSTRPNIYCCGIAPTGAGKDHARKLLGNLFEEAGAGRHVMGNNVTSDSAILKSLERNSSQIGFFDEIGLLMKELSSSNLASHKAGILSVMMQLYSSAGSTFKGTEYADRQRDRIDIVNPCLCIYGTTTPEPLFSAFSSEDSVSGYLNRWLFFRGDQNPPPSVLDFSGEKTKVTPPKHLVEQIQNVIVTNAFDQTPGTIVVNVSTDAQATFQKVWEEQQQRGPLWIRFFENMVKVAGIRAIADNCATPIVNSNQAQWARDLVRWCIEMMVHDVCRHVADGPYQKQLNKIHNLIINAGTSGITLSEISRKTTNMKADQRNPILMHLIEAHLATLTEEESPGSKKPVKRYHPINS